MSRYQKPQQIEIKAVLNLKDYEQKISLNDYINTLQVHPDLKAIALGLYKRHTDLKTYAEWQEIVEIEN